METKIIILAFYIVILTICAAVAFGCNMFKTCALCMVLIVIFGYMARTVEDNPVATSLEYYLSCEIVATNETSTYFGTVDQDKVQIYAVCTGGNEWPDDVPYLLHMDSMGTEDVTDDEVLMVWRAGR